MEKNVRFILERVLERDVRDDFTLPCVLGPITGVEEIWASGDCSRRRTRSGLSSLRLLERR